MPRELSDALRQMGRERGWSDAALQRIADARVPLSALGHWSWASLPPELVERYVDFHERLTRGDLRGREATLTDREALSELWARSPERIGDWEITTERSPDAFAQFRLQENLTYSVLAIGAQIVACVAWSRRNVLVEGRKLSVSFGQALRVHDDFRRQGYGDLVRRLPWGVGCAGATATQYDYMRTHNFAVVDWWKKYSPDFFDNTPERAGEVPGFPVSVSQLPAQTGAADAAVRRARRDDVARCAELINRTHAGLDLFRPHTAEWLESVLDEGVWGERPPWWQSIYGWDDFFVLESGGRVVACAGLWDRGRDVRERWQHKSGGEERVVADTAVLDFGFEAGAEEAMARLLVHLLDRTASLGRDHLVVALDPLPELAGLLGHLSPRAETRSLRWAMSDPRVTRPHTDLRYW